MKEAGIVLLGIACGLFTRPYFDIAVDYVVRKLEIILKALKEDK